MCRARRHWDVNKLPPMANKVVGIIQKKIDVMDDVLLGGEHQTVQLS